MHSLQLLRSSTTVGPCSSLASHVWSAPVPWGEHGLWWLHHHWNVSFRWGPLNSTKPERTGWCPFYDNTCLDMLGYSCLGYSIPNDASQNSFQHLSTLSSHEWKTALATLKVCALDIARPDVVILDSFTSFTNPKGLCHQLATNLNVSNVEVLYWYSPWAGFLSGLLGGWVEVRQINVQWLGLPVKAWFGFGLGCSMCQAKFRACS